MKKIKPLLGIAFLISTFATSCQKNEAYDVVCSSFPIYDLTAKIVKDKMNIKNLIKPGVEPHDYEMTTSDVKDLTNAKLFITIGLGFESYYDTLNNDIKNKSVITSNNIDIIKNNNVEDPHIWLNPLNAKTMAKNILDNVIKIDEDNSEYYTQNYNELITNLDKLDNDYLTKLTNLSSYDLVTSHAAFAYLCNRYHLNQISIAGLSPEDEPTAAKLKEIIDYINDNNIKTIFYEAIASDEIVKSISNETGVTFVELSPLEGLEDNDSDDDYFSIMYENLDKIYEALK